MKIGVVSRAKSHRFSKRPEFSIRLIEGHGVEGDAHAGRTVQQRYEKARDPLQPNLRQVHLLPTELLTELRGKGFTLNPGDIGENVLTEGIDLLNLPDRARLHLGAAAIIELTGIRRPCPQLDRFQNGLAAAVLDRDADGGLIRKSGVMAIVITGGDVSAGDPIRVELPPPPHRPLRPL